MNGASEGEGLVAFETGKTFRLIPELSILSLEVKSWMDKYLPINGRRFFAG